MATIYTRPTNGVSYGITHTVTSADAAVSGVAEVLTLTVTAGASADGNLSISLRGATAVTIAVLSTDTTASAVATKIRAGTFPGWTTSGTGADVIFTASATGAKTGTNTVGVASTGVTAAIVITTAGVTAVAGGVVFDFRNHGTSFRYPLVATVHLTSSAGLIDNTTGITLTYPSNGVVSVAGSFTAGQIIHLVAQRDSALITF